MFYTPLISLTVFLTTFICRTCFHPFLLHLTCQIGDLLRNYFSLKIFRLLKSIASILFFTLVQSMFHALWLILEAAEFFNQLVFHSHSMPQHAIRVSFFYLYELRYWQKKHNSMPIAGWCPSQFGNKNRSRKSLFMAVTRFGKRIIGASYDSMETTTLKYCKTRKREIDQCEKIHNRIKTKQSIYQNSRTRERKFDNHYWKHCQTSFASDSNQCSSDCWVFWRHHGSSHISIDQNF